MSLIFGTRPETVKLCPLILGLRERAGFEAHVCVTGQHRQMLDQILDAFGVVPDVDLSLMEPDQSLAGLTARAITAIDGYLAGHRPDLVVVQGDTTTTLCAALAAFYRHIPVAHVEAGLRTGNKSSPFPEEVNRMAVSRIADLHFAPTAGARENLLREGIDAHRIFVTGNPVIDALQIAMEHVRKQPPEISGLPAAVFEGNGDRPLVLVTGHRRESFGHGLKTICHAISELSRRFPAASFVYPVHLNPNVRKPVFGILRGHENVHLIEPLPYLAFVALMARSRIVLTDSGGVQEEAPCLGKPVLVMREATERPEAVDLGMARLVGCDRGRIVKSVSQLLTDAQAYNAMARPASPYGDGKATSRILDACEAFFLTAGAHR